MPEHGTFIWNQLVTSDQKKSGKFYSELLGWSSREVNAGPFGTYTIFSRDGSDVGGMMNPTTDLSRSRPSWWQAFIAVADVDACASRVVELGGSVIEPPHEIPGVGRACMVADPLGAVVQLMSPVSGNG
ncbi:MAG: VOC family protein [Georgfuchsia sp.]